MKTITDNDLPERKKTRLDEYDYSTAGAYFVTICTHNRIRILSNIRRGDPCGRPIVELSQLGKIADNAIPDIENKYDISIEKHVIMPNHIHMIVFIKDREMRATARVAPTLGNIIGGYKSLITNKWLNICKQHNITMGQIWQRGFYDHIIRTEQDYAQIWQYIDENPVKWESDEYYEQ